MIASIKSTIRKIAQKIYARYKTKKNIYQTPTENPFPYKNTAVDPEQSLERFREPPKSSITVDVSFTPNPNACKFDVSKRVSAESFSFSAETPPENHPLAKEILSIDGVSSVFGVHNFITATKKTEKEWEEISPKIIEAIQKHLL